jgi:hypothetical protein
MVIFVGYIMLTHFVIQKIDFDDKYFQRLLACFIAVGNRPLSTIENWHFRQLLLYLKPDLNIPGRRALCELIIREFQTEQIRMVSRPGSDLSLCRACVGKGSGVV